MRCLVIVTAAALSACASRPSQMPPGVDWESFVNRRAGDGVQVTLYQLRPGVCEGVDLKPEYTTLNEAALVRFLQSERYDVHVERQQVDSHSPELTYVFLRTGPTDPIALRVAILPNADDAGRALHEGILQRGPGSWGVHRSNLAVLGPVGSTADDIAFAAKTKLACWGTLTLGEPEEATVVPGGYAEP